MANAFKVGKGYIVLGRWYASVIVQGSTASIGMAFNPHHILGIAWVRETITDAGDRVSAIETKIYLTVIPLLPIVIQIDQLNLIESKVAATPQKEN